MHKLISIVRNQHDVACPFPFNDEKVKSILGQDHFRDFLWKQVSRDAFTTLALLSSAPPQGTSPIDSGGKEIEMIRT
jgi:hypothetical protein